VSAWKKPPVSRPLALTTRPIVYIRLVPDGVPSHDRVVKDKGLWRPGVFPTWVRIIENSLQFLSPGGEFAWEHLFRSCSLGVISLAVRYAYTTKTDLGIYEKDPRGPAWQSMV